MPKIDFYFKGWLSKADIKQASDVSGNEVDVSTMDADELAAKLNSGELFISLEQTLREFNYGKNTEIELHDFEAAIE